MRKISLNQENKIEIIKILSQMLADTYILYTKTQNFHWNVIDPRFYQLHKFFESQYEELAEALDIIAERIRMLGGRSPGTLSQFIEMSSLEENMDEISGDQMIRQLAEDHTTLSDFLRSWIEEATKMGDQGSADMMINRLRSHEKNSWMLQSHLNAGVFLNR